MTGHAGQHAFSEFAADPVQECVPFRRGRLSRTFRRHLAEGEPFFDQPPGFEVIPGQQIRVDIVQREIRFSQVRSVTIDAVIGHQWRYVVGETADVGCWMLGRLC